MRPVSTGINTIRNVGLDLKIHLKEQFHSIILAMLGLLFFRIVFHFAKMGYQIDAGVVAPSLLCSVSRSAALHLVVFFP